MAKMKTLGLLGGMTFDATAKYYDIINKYAKQVYGPRSSAPMFLYSADQEAMVTMAVAGRWEEFAKVYISAAKALIEGGAEAIVICAALAHGAADIIAASIDVPLLHIADAVGEAIAEKNIKCVALIATQAVMAGAFFKDRIQEQHGIQVLVPSEIDQQRVNTGIVTELTTGKVSSETKRMFLEVAEGLFAQGAEGLILGSTDLAFVIKPEDVKVPTFDTATIHALTVAKWATES